jgi:hypothetical protein
MPLIAEEFALRIQKNTGCQIVDQELYRVMGPAQLVAGSLPRAVKRVCTSPTTAELLAAMPPAP